MEIKYPNGFFSFTSGKKISTDEINKWIEEVRSEIKKGSEYSCISSGNTTVIAFNNGDDIEIVVAKDYKTKFVDK